MEWIASNDRDEFVIKDTQTHTHTQHTHTDTHTHRHTHAHPYPCPFLLLKPLFVLCRSFTQRG